MARPESSAPSSSVEAHGYHVMVDRQEIVPIGQGGTPAAVRGIDALTAWQMILTESADGGDRALKSAEPAFMRGEC